MLTPTSLSAGKCTIRSSGDFASQETPFAYHRPQLRAGHASCGSVQGSVALQLRIQVARAEPLPHSWRSRAFSHGAPTTPTVHSTGAPNTHASSPGAVLCLRRLSRPARRRPARLWPRCCRASLVSPGTEGGALTQGPTRVGHPGLSRSSSLCDC